MCIFKLVAIGYEITKDFATMDTKHLNVNKLILFLVSYSFNTVTTKESETHL